MSTTKVKCPTCGADAVCRFAGSEDEFYESVLPDGDSASIQLSKIRSAINGYFLALDEKHDGGAAQFAAFQKIQIAMDMNWEPGKVLKEVEKLPSLRKIYQK